MSSLVRCRNYNCKYNDDHTPGGGYCEKDPLYIDEESVCEEYKDYEEADFEDE